MLEKIGINIFIKLIISLYLKIKLN